MKSLEQETPKQLHVPQEIIEFYEKDRGQSIILRGPAGSGKTIFAVRLLERLAATQQTIYLTTKELDERLSEQFSWLGKHIGDKILDAGRDRSEASTVFNNNRLNHINNKNSQKLKMYPQIATTNNHEGVGKHGEICRVHLSKLLSVVHLPELEMLYEKVEAGLPGKTIAIVDTIEGIANRCKYDGTSLSLQEVIDVIQKDLVERSGTNMVFILGQPTANDADFLVDGVISLHMKDVEGRRVREFLIEKLRTVNIKQPTYIFTLSDGKFRCFEPYKYQKISEPRLWEPIQDTSLCFSTGSKDLDEMLGGGYLKGSYNLIEIDGTVSHDGFISLILPTICNFVRLGRGVVMVPEGGSSPEHIRRIFLPFVGKEAFLKHFRILVSRTGKTDRSYILTDAESPKERAKIWENTFYKLKEEIRQPILDFTSFSTLEYEIGGNTAIKEIGEGIKLIKDGGDLGIGILRPGLTMAQEVKNMADTHLRIVEMDGSYLLYGVKPKTQTFNINADTSKGFPELKLSLII